mgnify:CR=1 FL=1
MTSSSPGLAPMDHEDAERVARVAIDHGGQWVGPRVLEALRTRIVELEIERGLLRRELDGLAARALEDARLRAHALMPRRVPIPDELRETAQQMARSYFPADTEGAGR